MKFLKPIALVTLIAGLAIGMVVVIRQATVKPRPWPFTDAIREAERMVVYEGLPHQVYEEKLLEQELKRKDIQKIDDYFFYQAPLELSRDDAARLQRVLANPETYRVTTDAIPPCGGFHPDFAVEWTVKGDKYRALACFGCGEFKLFGPNLYERPRMEGRDVSKALRDRRQNRPFNPDEDMRRRGGG